LVISEKGLNSIPKRGDIKKRKLTFVLFIRGLLAHHKLEDRASSIHLKQIERFKSLEKQHEARVAVLRRSFTQQLQDAIILIRSQYRNDLNIELKEATADLKENDLSHANNFQRLLKRTEKDLLKANETIVQRDAEVACLKQHLVNNLNDNRMHDPSELLKTKQLLEEQTKDFLAQADKLDQIKNEAQSLKNEVKDLKTQTRSKERQIVELQSHNAEIKDKMIRIEIQTEFEKPVKVNSHQSKRQIKSNKVESHKSNLKVTKKIKVDDQTIPLEKYKKLQHTLKILQDQNEFNIKQAVLAEKDLNESLVRNLKNEIKELTKKINFKDQEKNTMVKLRKSSGDFNEKLIHQRWAKKFQVLHASLHAIKEESYVRSQLHKKLKTTPVTSQNFNSSSQQEFCTSVVSLPQQGFDQPTHDDCQKSCEGFDQIIEEEETMMKGFEQLEFNQDPIEERDLSFVSSKSSKKATFGHYMPGAHSKNTEN